MLVVWITKEQLLIFINRHQLQKQLSVGGSSCQILEVSTRRVTKSTAEANTVENSVSHHHIHHPPEIIVSPDSKRVPIHSELEITVRAKASKHAKVRWVHDGETVTFKGNGYFWLIPSYHRKFWWFYLITEFLWTDILFLTVNLSLFLFSNFIV